MQMHRLDNKSLVPFMEEARPEWVACRWISVNGLSWDVIRLLGNDKGLHRLAIEDLVTVPRQIGIRIIHIVSLFSRLFSDLRVVSLLIEICFGTYSTSSLKARKSH